MIYVSFTKIDSPKTSASPAKILEGAIFDNNTYVNGYFNINIDDTGSGSVILTRPSLEEAYISPIEGLIINGEAASTDVDDLWDQLATFSIDEGFIDPADLAVIHDTTLLGDGSTDTPLGVNSDVYKIRSLAAGANITLTNPSPSPLGNLQIDFEKVYTDSTLTGLGLSTNTLKVDPTVYTVKRIASNGVNILSTTTDGVAVINFTGVVTNNTLAGDGQASNPLHVNTIEYTVKSITAGKSILVTTTNGVANVAFDKVYTDTSLTGQGISTDTLKVNSNIFKVKDIAAGTGISVSTTANVVTITNTISVIDSLVSTSSTNALSANQGKVLFEYITALNEVHLDGPYINVAAIPTPYQDNYIYLVGTTAPYEQYAYVGSSLLLIGTTNIDLSDYDKRTVAEGKFILANNIVKNINKPVFLTDSNLQYQVRLASNPTPLAVYPSAADGTVSADAFFSVRTDGTFFFALPTSPTNRYMAFDSTEGLSIYSVNSGAKLTLGATPFNDLGSAGMSGVEALIPSRLSGDDFMSKTISGFNKLAINTTNWEVQKLVGATGITVTKGANGQWTITNTGGAWGAITGAITNQTDLVNTFVLANGNDATLEGLNDEKKVVFNNTQASTMYELLLNCSQAPIEMKNISINPSGKVVAGTTWFSIKPDGSFELRKSSSLNERYMTFNEVSGLEVRTQSLGDTGNVVRLGSKEQQDMGVEGLNSVEAITPTKVSAVDFMSRKENRGHGNYDKLAINSNQWKVKNIIPENHITATALNSEWTIGHDGYKQVELIGNLFEVTGDVYTLPSVNDYKLGDIVCAMMKGPNSWNALRGGQLVNQSNHFPYEWYCHPYADFGDSWDKAGNHHWSQHVPQSVLDTGVKRVGFPLNKQWCQSGWPAWKFGRTHDGIVQMFWNQKTVTLLDGTTKTYSGSTASDGIRFETALFDNVGGNRKNQVCYINSDFIQQDGDPWNGSTQGWSQTAVVRPPTQGWGTLSKTARWIYMKKPINTAYVIFFRCDEDAMSGTYDKVIGFGGRGDSGWTSYCVLELNDGTYYSTSNYRDAMSQDYASVSVIRVAEGEYQPYWWYYLGENATTGAKEWKTFWPDDGVNDTVSGVVIPALQQGHSIVGTWIDKTGEVLFTLNTTGERSFFNVVMNKPCTVASDVPDLPTVSAGANITVTATGTAPIDYSVATSFSVIDTLTSTSSIDALSAKQGKTLKDLLGSLESKAWNGPYASITDVPTPYSDNYIYLVHSSDPSPTPDTSNALINYSPDVTFNQGALGLLDGSSQTASEEMSIFHSGGFIVYERGSHGGFDERAVMTGNLLSLTSFDASGNTIGGINLIYGLSVPSIAVGSTTKERQMDGQQLSSMTSNQVPSMLDFSSDFVLVDV